MLGSHSWSEYGCDETIVPHHRGNEYGVVGARELLEESPSSPSLSFYASLFCLQVVTSLVSMFASIVVVRISSPKLDTAYQRIVFLLNIALVINSIFLGLHPLLVDNSGSHSAYWAIGNSTTCSILGFFLTFGSLAVSMYHTALAFYFYFSIQTIYDEHKNQNNNNNDDDDNDNSGKKDTESVSSETSSEEKFCPGSEIMENVVCLLVPVVIAGVAACLNSFGYDPSIGFCTFHGSSNTNRDGDTSWRVPRNVFRWTLVASGAITVLVTLIIRLRVAAHQTKQCNNAENSGDIGRNKKNSNRSESSVTDPDADLDREERIIIGQKLRAISAQSMFYTVSYLSSYFWFITLAFLSATDGASKNVKLVYAFQLMTVIFYPLLGVFNCVIYVRPRVQMLRIMYPEDSFAVALRVCVSKAGDREEIEKVRAKIYGGNYSRSREMTPQACCEPSFGDEDEDDYYPSGNLPVPSVVHFDQSCAISVKSLVTTGDETDDGTHDEHAS
eukprot:jgi/Psemu1/2177/gm1.2177_g